MKAAHDEQQRKISELESENLGQENDVRQTSETEALNTEKKKYEDEVRCINTGSCTAEGGNERMKMNQS
jgi:hypothetical protein